jgi:hypothetical protein
VKSEEREIISFGNPFKFILDFGLSFVSKGKVSIDLTPEAWQVGFFLLVFQVAAPHQPDIIWKFHF